VLKTEGGGSAPTTRGLRQLEVSVHCLVVLTTCGKSFGNDKQTVGFLVPRGTTAEEVSQSLRLEIYLIGGRRETIEPGVPILDWHFWKDGQQVSAQRFE